MSIRRRWKCLYVFLCVTLCTSIFYSLKSSILLSDSLIFNIGLTKNLTDSHYQKDLHIIPTFNFDSTNDSKFLHTIKPHPFNHQEGDLTNSEGINSFRALNHKSNSLILHEKEYNVELHPKLKKDSTKISQELEIKNSNIYPPISMKSKSSSTLREPSDETNILSHKKDDIKSSSRHSKGKNTLRKNKKSLTSASYLFNKSIDSIREDMKLRNFTGHPHKFVPGEKISGVNRMKIIIVTTFRSGSTFLGDLLNSYPGTFYSFEPLHSLYNGDFKNNEEISSPTNLIADILNCRYEKYKEYLKHEKFISFNKAVHKACKSINRLICKNPQFQSQACQYFPINLIKTTRLSLKDISLFLNETASQPTKMIYLVRDPRGTANSRRKIKWCRKNPQCFDTKTVCDAFKDEVKLSEKYLQQYPERFTRVKYEDLSQKPQETTQKILKFLDLPFHYDVEMFLSRHTNLSNFSELQKKKLISRYSTYRDSSTRTFAWMNNLSSKKINEIEKYCSEPLKTLGYPSFKNLKRNNFYNI